MGIISCTTLTSLLFSESGIMASKSASDKEPKTEVLDLEDDSGFFLATADWALFTAAEEFLFSDGTGFFLGSLLDSVEPGAVVVTVL